MALFLRIGAALINIKDRDIVTRRVNERVSAVDAVSPHHDPVRLFTGPHEKCHKFVDRMHGHLLFVAKERTVIDVHALIQFVHCEEDEEAENE